MSAPTRNKTEAHRRRKQYDAREVLPRGGQYDVVVEEISDDGTPMAHIEQVRTFILKRNGVYKGDRLRVRISDRGDDWAQAVVIAHLN